MDALTVFGLFSVIAMLIFYAFEDSSRWYVLAFAAACALGSIYGFLQGAWPFGLVEAIWSLAQATGAHSIPHRALHATEVHSLACRRPLPSSRDCHNGKVESS